MITRILGYPLLKFVVFASLARSEKQDTISTFNGSDNTKIFSFKNPNWIRLSKRAHFSILISAFKSYVGTPQVVKTGFDGHLVFQEVKNPRLTGTTWRPFCSLLCPSQILMHLSLALPKIEAGSLHLQFMEVLHNYQRSPIFILNDFASPKFSWNFMGDKKQFICCLFAIIMIITRGNKYQIELWP